jgi:hypothetical protein
MRNNDDSIDDVVLFTDDFGKEVYFPLLNLRKAYNVFFNVSENSDWYEHFLVPQIIKTTEGLEHRLTRTDFIQFLEEYKNRLDFNQKLDKILE